jgi:HSP20 family protein
MERLNGRFHRRFALPDTIDSGAVRASGKNGVLQIEIPKQPNAQPKRIQLAVDN